ncbi:MAG: hypothetical protein VB959_00030 [Rhodospirillales bacterium]
MIGLGIFGWRVRSLTVFGLALVALLSSTQGTTSSLAGEIGAVAPGWDIPRQLTKGIRVNTAQFLPDGRLLISGNDSVIVLNADGTNRHKLFSHKGVRRANMSPLGGSIVLDNDFDIFLADPAGVRIRPIANDPDLFEFATSFTPNGRHITYVTIDDATTTYGIWIMNPNGTNKQNLLTRKKLAFRHPRQSPLGGVISFFSVGPGVQPRIWLLDKRGGQITPLTNPESDGISRQASWRSDGQILAYSSRKFGDFDIWVMDADGRNKSRITNLKGNEAKPAWSPDGNAIAFLCSRCDGTPGSDLYIIQRR